MKLKSVIEEDATVSLRSTQVLDEPDADGQSAREVDACMLQLDDFAGGEHTGVVVALLGAEARAIGDALVAWSEEQADFSQRGEAVGVLQAVAERLGSTGARQAGLYVEQVPVVAMPLAERLAVLLSDEERLLIERRLGCSLETAFAVQEGDS